MNKNKTKGLSKFSKAVIFEIIILGVLLVLFRAVIFPKIGITRDMLHIQIATHVFVIGLCLTTFTAVAIFVKREWRSHKKYIIIPVIFTVFGFLMQKFAEEISFVL